MIIWAPPSKCANFPPFLKEDAISILAFSGPQRDGREAPGAMVSDLMDLAAEGRERYRPMSTKTSDLVQRTIWRTRMTPAHGSWETMLLISPEHLGRLREQFTATA